MVVVYVYLVAFATTVSDHRRLEEGASYPRAPGRSAELALTIHWAATTGDEIITRLIYEIDGSDSLLHQQRG